MQPKDGRPMTEFLLPDFVWRALIGGVGVALLAGPLGCFVVWRRMAYFGETLAHSAFLGVALGLLLHLDPVIGVLAVSVVIALVLARRQPAEGIAEDTLLGLLAHTSLALGLVVLAFMEDVRVDLFSYLFGDILALRAADLGWILLIDVVGLSLLAWLWQGLLALTVHEELAAVEGRRVKLLQLAFMLVLAVFVALAMKLVGILLTVAMLIIPAAAARRLARTPVQMALGAAAIGAVAVLLGLLASLHSDLPSGPAMVVAAALLFLLLRVLPQRG
ncbi:zinc transporter subunit: membrane component of ABC superfamily [Thiomonas sp. CB2]|nr:zinc transporter subunit: membrane component of ABC superfamily [Thiomonas sp. CB2]CQR42104.1 zinc transporter subunit: membrane component of ABC superfamily [Thiomonas sp. CB3]VDY11664.1 High-affinity zinc uptake ABC system membrane protein [Thiomonas sp. OC7]